MAMGLKRKQSLRDAYADKMRKSGGKAFWRSDGTFKKRKPLKKQSHKRASQMELYYQERREYLQKPENAVCAICLVLGNTPQASTEVHHSRSRSGRLLRDQRFWIPSCRGCREIPHQRPKWAREMGILCSASEWGVYPSEL
jgi:hypothetical protein